MKPHDGQLMRRKMGTGAGNAANRPDLDAGRGSGLLKRSQLLARVRRTDYEGGRPDQAGVAGDQSEAAAVIDVQISKVEGEQKQLAAIDDQEFAVISGQVVGRARHRDSGIQKAHFELAKVFLAAAIGIRDQRMDKDAARGRVRQGLLDFTAIESKNDDLDAVLGAIDGVEQRLNAVAGLNQQFQIASGGGELQDAQFIVTERRENPGIQPAVRGLGTQHVIEDDFQGPRLQQIGHALAKNSQESHYQ